MSTLEVLLAPILHSPQLAEITLFLQRTLEEERSRRGQFYADMRPDQKVEFIDGSVILHSPARNVHLQVTGWIFTLLNTYVSRHDLGTVNSEKCLCVFPRNDYEPDLVFFGTEKSALLKNDTMKFPIPDLAIEVLSDSTAARDRGVKFTDIEAHGVQEYWIVDAEESLIEQYVRRGNRLELRMKSGTGELRSTAVPGFIVPVRACFDRIENLKTLHAIMMQ